MSYGVNAPQGLQPSQYLNGSTFSGQTSEYNIASGYNTALFSGDPVVGLANGTIGLATAGTTNPVIGVFYGVKYIDTTGASLSLPYWLANTATQGGLLAFASIIDDFNVLYDIQVNVAFVGNSGNAAQLTQADLNATANLVAGAGTQRTGQSGWSLGSTTNTTRDQVRLIRFTPNPKNLAAIANTAGTNPNFANCLVMLNNDPYKGGVGAAGFTGTAGV